MQILVPRLKCTLIYEQCVSVVFFFFKLDLEEGWEDGSAGKVLATQCIQSPNQ